MVDNLYQQSFHNHQGIDIVSHLHLIDMNLYIPYKYRSRLHYKHHSLQHKIYNLLTHQDLIREDKHNLQMES